MRVAYRELGILLQAQGAGFFMALAMAKLREAAFHHPKELLLSTSFSQFSSTLLLHCTTDPIQNSLISNKVSTLAGDVELTKEEMRAIRKAVDHT